ncbi:MAG: NUDIX domain-containing protein [bacterium]|nr:NUDIX domain-containing protein [bacterium]
MTYSVWVNEQWVDVPVPEMGGEALVVPNVAAIVLSTDRTTMLLQRRDKIGEPVRGKLEIPGGRWGAGEAPEDAVAREVREETGIELVEPPAGVSRIEISENRACAAVHPVAVVNGLDGVYPSLHVVFECTGEGRPRAQPGETADPQWWPLDDVRKLLAHDPDQFVDQTRAMLTVYFGG